MEIDIGVRSRHEASRSTIERERKSIVLCPSVCKASMSSVPVGGIVKSEGNRENDAEVLELARFAVDEHNKKANAALEFDRVVELSTQVVAGIMYYITLEANDGGTKKLYEAKVWVQGWMNFKQLEDFNEVQSSTTNEPREFGGQVEEQEEDNDPPLVGGIQDKEGWENDTKFDELAHFAIEEYNKKENTLLEFSRVVHVKTQVVAGVMYYITLEAKEGDEKKLYEAKIWEQAWNNFKQLEEFKSIS